MDVEKKVTATAEAIGGPQQDNTTVLTIKVG